MSPLLSKSKETYFENDKHNRKLKRLQTSTDLNLYAHLTKITME